jgi:predicted component of type VI protein secretion system
MAKLVLSSGGSVLNNYFIEKQRVAIGRAAQNDVNIDDPLVGEQHAAIITVGEDQIIEGLDGTYGTFVNGKRISRHMLQHRDVIEFGAFSLCYLNSKAAQETEFDRTMIIEPLPRPVGDADRATLSAARAARAARVVNVRFPSGRMRRLDDARSPQVVELNRVVAPVGTPGEYLAVITRRPHGYFVTHVEGQRRARLNGIPIGEEPRALRNGDVIELADERFELEVDPATT